MSYQFAANASKFPGSARPWVRVRTRSDAVGTLEDLRAVPVGCVKRTRSFPAQRPGAFHAPDERLPGAGKERAGSGPRSPSRTPRGGVWLSMPVASELVK